jgi:hypothetical protein
MPNKFTKSSLSEEEKEKQADDFLNFSTEANREKLNNTEEIKPKIIERVLEKEDKKRMTMRLPVSFYNDITEISVITGLSKNSVVLELLRSTAKKKIQELKD